MCSVTTNTKGLSREAYRRQRVGELHDGQRRVQAGINRLREKSPRLYRQLAPLLDDLSDWVRDATWHLNDLTAEEQPKPPTPAAKPQEQER